MDTTHMSVVDDAQSERVRRTAGLVGELSSNLEIHARRGNLGAAVKILRSVLDLWAEVLRSTFVEDRFARSELTAADRRANVIPDNALEFVGELVRDFTQRLADGVPDDTVARARELMTLLHSLMTKELVVLPEEDGEKTARFDNYRVHVVKQLSELDAEARLQELIAEATDAVKKTKESAGKAAQAAGQTGTSGMSLAYQKLAGEELKAANGFRWATIGMSAAAAALATLFIFGPILGMISDFGTNDYPHLFQRIVFLAGILGLAGYFARQAHHHRAMANWARSVDVQLQTFEAFLDPVSNEDVRNELRQAFAVRVFGDHPAMKGEPPVTSSAAVLDAAVSLAAKLSPGGK